MSQLSQAQVQAIWMYDPYTGVLRWRVSPSIGVAAGGIAGTLDKTGYIRVRYKGKAYLAHVLAWIYMKGELPPNEIDHEDRVKKHNWIDNLRPATLSQNRSNVGVRSDNTSGVRGVTYHKRDKCWQASIGVNGA